MTTANYISEHPAIALIVGVVHITLAEFLKDIEVPVIVMQLFQLGAWTVTITVGLMTIRGAYKKWRK